jgi:hypothetical protein
MPARRLTAVASLSSALLGLACASSSSGAALCNITYDCPSGQTFWSTNGTTFECMTPGPLKAELEAS